MRARARTHTHTHTLILHTYTTLFTIILRRGREKKKKKITLSFLFQSFQISSVRHVRRTEKCVACHSTFHHTTLIYFIFYTGTLLRWSVTLVSCHSLALILLIDWTGLTSLRRGPGKASTFHSQLLHWQRVWYRVTQYVDGQDIWMHRLMEVSLI